ncbi:MAG: hypothetical protein FWF18_03195 [Dehalococcoidia bacterium]|nr:hypothetical protein [Dehalococcoidia bacterium]
MKNRTAIVKWSLCVLLLALLLTPALAGCGRKGNDTGWTYDAAISADGYSVRNDIRAYKPVSFLSRDDAYALLKQAQAQYDALSAVMHVDKETYNADKLLQSTSAYSADFSGSSIRVVTHGVASVRMWMSVVNLDASGMPVANIEVYSPAAGKAFQKDVKNDTPPVAYDSASASFIIMGIVETLTPYRDLASADYMGELKAGKLEDGNTLIQFTNTDTGVFVRLILDSNNRYVFDSKFKRNADGAMIYEDRDFSVIGSFSVPGWYTGE